MAEQLELEAQIQREMAGSEDFLEGAIGFWRSVHGPFRRPSDPRGKSHQARIRPEPE